MMFAYLLALGVSIFGMVTLDRRFKLAFFADATRTVWTLAVAMGVFILWDIAGIALGIFRKGESNLTLNIEILPEFPIEELFFLFLLCYISLLGYLYAKRRIKA